ncbi:hypothetical protein BB559_003329 [Furculomyces boomerangus]|uniref:Uncharacterized protein n=2 Tax=Harpellales TaxID=61421 RepID=A0A2T9YB41_9FUNG|nr:hypothetical protein BB559_005040 [Furculomyces boomerangus]PVU93331.1 hypothetical protein BB559_003329 [Furculomyces boomerangus]PWA01564.1 hypothetical protein BB558_002346 [Smittium angustum]
MTFDIRISQGLSNGIMQSPRTVNYEIKGDNTGATVDCTVITRKNDDSYSGSVSGSQIEAILKSIEDLTKLPMFETPVPQDVYGKDTSVMVRKDGKVLWAYGVTSGCTYDYEDQEGSDGIVYAVSDTQKNDFSSIINDLTSVGEAACNIK